LNYWTILNHLKFFLVVQNFLAIGYCLLALCTVRGNISAALIVETVLADNHILKHGLLTNTKTFKMANCRHICLCCENNL